MTSERKFPLKSSQFGSVMPTKLDKIENLRDSLPAGAVALRWTLRPALSIVASANRNVVYTAGRRPQCFRTEIKERRWCRAMRLATPPSVVAEGVR